MPSIAQLPLALVSADTDEIVANQGGSTRKVTRAQLLAGTQPRIVAPQTTLLGRTSTGAGDPEPITLGPNLALSGATLSALVPKSLIASLPAGRAPLPADLVPVGQDGLNASLPYARFMGGIAGVRGIDVSGLAVTPTGTTAGRSLADLLADAVRPEDFGAAGDGATDDSAALAAAVGSGRPVRLGPKTYVVNGQWTIAQPAVLLGVPGQSVLRRDRQVGTGSWISVQGTSFVAAGVVFDANRAAVPTESWGVLITASCLRSDISGCVFANAQGPTLGNGIAFLASDPAPAQHVVRGCELRGNAAHGLWAQAVNGVQVVGCRAHDNAGYGICLDDTDPSFARKLRAAQVQDNACWANQRGISVGNYNASNTIPPVWGNANPDAIGVLVAGNDCHDNAVYGIAAAGSAIAVDGNLLSNNGSTANGGAGILANVQSSRICGNVTTGASQYGIDSGGSIDTDIAQNHVTGAAIGINPGGSQRVRVAGNFIQGCGWAVTVYHVETDGQGRSFGLPTETLSITDNWIAIPGAAGGGVYLVDAPQGVVVARNSFVGLGGASVAQALWAHTDAVIVEGNRWNNQQRFICNPIAAGGLQQVQVPDIADEVMITDAPAGVQSIVTLHQASVQGQVSFVKVTDGGAGYTRASVAIAGAGAGAAAGAIVADGQVIGVALTSPGSGYDAATTVTIAGDGTGAAATIAVGLPVPEERRLRVACNGAVRFARAGSSPFQDNWTLADFTAAAGSEVEWVGTWGAWRAVRFAASDYLAPPGDGSLVVRTMAGGDLVLRPSGGGHLRMATDADPAGYLSAVGHGSPEGVVSAPAGSDYRNLDGGAGATLWIKCSPAGATGWVAIA